MDDEIFTLKEVAARLKIAERTIYAMATSRELPAFKIRGHWRIRASDFRGWLDRQAAQSEVDRESELPQGADHAGEIKQPAEEIATEDGRAPQSGPAALSERRSQPDLHRYFVELLGESVVEHSPFEQKPLEMILRPPLPARVRLYVFNATRPPGGRPTGEHKIQLIMPGQKRGERGNFDHGDSRIVLLAGYAAEEDVFIFWDAGLYADFAWSRNVQVKAETIVNASAGKLATQERHLRQVKLATQERHLVQVRTSTSETVLAAPATKLGEAIGKRVHLTRERMARD